MAEARALNCPSCGGRLEQANWFVRMVVCQYCGSTVAIESDRLDLIGKSAALVQTPSRFALGRTGKLRGQPFRVLGRVRFDADDSYWDEWYLEFADGSGALLEEEEGQYTLSQKASLTAEVPPFDAVKIGSTLMVNGQPFFVTERCRATVAGAEGQLPYLLRPGQPVQFVDGNLGGKVAAIEYGDDSIEYTVGEPVERADVMMDVQ